MFPSKELHKVWKRWVNAYRWIYNWTIAKLKEGNKASAYDLQKLARDAERPDWVKDLPGHQLQEAVADAVDTQTSNPGAHNSCTSADRTPVVGWNWMACKDRARPVWNRC